MVAQVMSSAETRVVAPGLAEVERLFVHEAALLDSWRLGDWLKLIADDGRYLVPSLDSPDGSHESSLFLIADDIVHLRSRVDQLQSRSIWAENPRSRTRRLITNVDIAGGDDGETIAMANFAVWRFQEEQVDTYVGRYVYKIVRAESGELRIRERRAILDLLALRPHGKLSFIL